MNTIEVVAMQLLHPLLLLLHGKSLLSALLHKVVVAPEHPKNLYIAIDTRSYNAEGDCALSHRIGQTKFKALILMEAESNNVVGTQSRLFRVMTWNVLMSHYATKKEMPYVADPQWLETDYRIKLIVSGSIT